jgi:hypothetical protein
MYRIVLLTENSICWYNRRHRIKLNIRLVINLYAYLVNNKV